MSNFVAPSDIAKSLVDVSEKKASGTIVKLFILGILAGVYIGFAAHLATTIATGPFEWFGMKKFLVGTVFSVGLMLVMIPGSELWTGNTLMTVGLLEKKISFAGLLRNWGAVYFGNFVGSVLLAFIIAASTGLLDGAVGSTAINIAYAKVTAAPQGLDHTYAYFFRAIGCNWLVCLAIMMALASKDIGGKILAIFFPIMAFVASGFEHCVANMYFIPAGIFGMNFDKAVVSSKAGSAAIVKAVDAGTLDSAATVAQQAEAVRPLLEAKLNWTAMWSQNLVIVTAGNFVGGAILVGVVYWFIYVKGADKA